jgi:hypothetical protein
MYFLPQSRIGRKSNEGKEGQKLKIDSKRKERILTIKNITGLLSSPHPFYFIFGHKISILFFSMVV